MNRDIFDSVAGAHPGRSVFDLSYDKKFTADMGLIYPIFCEEVIPGDVLDISFEAVVRMAPAAKPILHRMDLDTYWFEIPNRLIFPESTRGVGGWENFITGGEDGDDSTTLPTWSPSATAVRDEGTLWDFLFGTFGVTPDADSLPLDFGRRAYMMVFNEYFRDQNTDQEIDWEQTPGTDQDVQGNGLTLTGDEYLQWARWKKDYFTAALPWQQRGTAPQVAITGSAVWGSVGTSAGNMVYAAGNDPGAATTKDTLENNTLAGVMDIDDLRLTLAIQKWLERNARSGVRHNEFIRAHFGVDVGDHRLDRPFYIGGAKMPIIVSEVLGTNQDGSTNGHGALAGHGIGADTRRIGKHRVKEYGWILGVAVIRPTATYHQGIERQWTRRTRYDFYSPEFDGLSEQGILRREIYLDTVKANNETVFGYIGAWDEYRTKHSMLAGNMHPGATVDESYWHIARDFASAPTLNPTFLSFANVRKDWLFDSNAPAFWINWANLVKAVRPMSGLSMPRLVS